MLDQYVRNETGIGLRRLLGRIGPEQCHLVGVIVQSPVKRSENGYAIGNSIFVLKGSQGRGVRARIEADHQQDFARGQANGGGKDKPDSAIQLPGVGRIGRVIECNLVSGDVLQLDELFLDRFAGVGPSPRDRMIHDFADDHRADQGQRVVRLNHTLVPA